MHRFVWNEIILQKKPVYQRVTNKVANKYTVTLCILMEFSIHIDTITMGLSIVYFKG